MKGNGWKVMAVGTMALTMLCGCGDSSTTTKESIALNEGDTVKIGLNFELSGDVSSYGQAERNAAQLAIEQYNERTDTKFKAEGIEVDDKGDAAESTTQATKLIEEDHVVAIIGPATSGASIATYAIASQNATPVISPSATQVDAMMDGDTAYEYAWRICFEDSYQGAAMAIYAADTLDCKKAAIINETSDYGQGLANQFEETFKEHGGEVVAHEQYNAGDTDFASMLTKIKDTDFDVLYIAGYYSEAGLIIKQARADGIDCPIVGADGFESEKLVQLAGKENLNEVWYTTAYTTVNASDELNSFIEAYTKKYNEAPNMFSALAYDATNLVLDQLEATGATGEELNEAIKKANFTGITGTFTFDETTHTPIKSVMVVNQVDGVQTEATEVAVD